MFNRPARDTFFGGKVTSPHMHIALCQVALGDLVAAKAAVETARRFAPDYIQARLDSPDAFLYRSAQDRQRAHVFLRIAAGLEASSAAEALK